MKRIVFENRVAMHSRNLGFMSSWKMLTRDKGWIKPLLVLTLVGMIPVVGQIALLGYAFEWARLTAWGVDSAPKQRGVDYGKVMSTGFRAFLVAMSMGLVAGFVLEIIFPGAIGVLASGYAFGTYSTSAIVAMGSGVTIIFMLLMLFVNSFIVVAMMRATIYDSFTAGWRLDRLFQMVVRDFPGFLKTILVSLIGAAIVFAYSFVTAFIFILFLAGGALSAASVLGFGSMWNDSAYAVRELLSWGAGPLLILMVLGLLAMFAGSVLSTGVTLIGVNAVGQWFCRFDVNRWGLSGDPLPDGVPNMGTGAAASAPVPPANDAQSTAGGCAPQADPFVTTDRPTATAPVDAVVPLDAPVQAPAAAPTAAPVEQQLQPSPGNGASAQTAQDPAGNTAEAVDVPAAPTRELPSMDEVVADDAAAPAVPRWVDVSDAPSAGDDHEGSREDGGSVQSAAEALEAEDAPEAEETTGCDGEDGDADLPVGQGTTKQPIPLGPITSDGFICEEDRPIDA